MRSAGRWGKSSIHRELRPLQFMPWRVTTVMENPSIASNCAFPPPTCDKTGKQKKEPHGIVIAWGRREPLKGERTCPTSGRGSTLGPTPLGSDGSEPCAEKLPGVTLLEFWASRGSGNIEPHRKPVGMNVLGLGLYLLWPPSPL